MPRVVYDFIAQGADAVEEAFKRIGQERRQSKQGGSVSGGGGRRGPDPAAQAAKEEERRAKADRQAKEREERQKTQAQQREAKQRTAASQREANEKKRIADAQVKEEERARKKQDAERERAERKATRDREREAKKRANAETKEEEIRQRQRRRERAAVITGVAAAGGAFIGSVASRGASASMSLAESALKDRIDLNDAALRVAINARGAGQDLGSVVKLKDQFTQIGQDAKVKPIDVATGVQAFITKTGEAGKAMEFAPIVATAAKAADANLESVSKTAADLFQKFGIQTADEMQKALAAIYFGGKSGAFELSDFAEKMAPIASAGQRFGVDKGVEGVKTMQGLAQIAMSAVGDRDRAATAVEATLRQLVSKSTDLGAMGVKVFDQKTNKTRNVTDVLTETISAVGGLDAQKKAAGLQKIFGDEGIRGISPLVDKYMTAVNTTKGSAADKRAAGEAAVKGALDSAINAVGDWSEVVKDAGYAQDSSSSKINAAWDEMKGKIGEALLPAFDKIAERMPQFAEDIADVSGALGDLAMVLVDILDSVKSTGLFDFNAEKRSSRLATQASKETARLEDIAKTRALTPEEQKKLDASRSKETALTSQAEFIAEFVKKDTRLFGGKADANVDAKAYWDLIQQNPTEATAYANRWSGVQLPFMVSGQNDAQLELIKKAADQRRAAQSAQSTGENPATFGAQELNKALQEAARAARQFSSQANPDSVFAGG